MEVYGTMEARVTRAPKLLQQINKKKKKKNEMWVGEIPSISMGFKLHIR